eukprot:gene32446-31060_t
MQEPRPVTGDGGLLDMYIGPRGGSNCQPDSSLQPGLGHGLLKDVDSRLANAERLANSAS